MSAILGAGATADRAKRPLMGEIASRLADRVIVTSDNPRSEDPEAIIDEVVVPGVGPGPPGVEHNVDRRDAAIAGASRGDVVVIAGKGHEQRQGLKLPFDDASMARREAALARMGLDSSADRARGRCAAVL